MGLKTGQRGYVWANIATFSRVLISTSQCSGQHHDIPERLYFNVDIPEGSILNVATFESNVATL